MVNVEAALRSIAQRWPNLRSPSDEEPVFLLAAGWRTGSTLVQRMLVGRCLVFGEPYGRAVPVEHLARQFEPFNEAWPPNENFIDRRDRIDNLAGDWIANLTPPIDALLRAHVAWFEALFREPAERLGYTRWGFKEVRLGIEHARYLRFVFPRARFLMLIRDPYAAYNSFKAFHVAFRSWPDEPVHTPELFGRHWRRLTEGFLEGAEALGGRMLRYEEVCAPGFDPRPLEDYLGFAVDLGARAVRAGAFASPPATDEELKRCASEVEPLAGRLGYRRAAR